MARGVSCDDCLGVIANFVAECEALVTRPEETVESVLTGYPMCWPDLYDIYKDAVETLENAGWRTK